MISENLDLSQFPLKIELLCLNVDNTQLKLPELTDEQASALRLVPHVSFLYIEPEVQQALISIQETNT